LKVKSIGRENNLYKEGFGNLQSSWNIMWVVKSKQERWKDHFIFEFPCITSL